MKKLIKKLSCFMLALFLIISGAAFQSPDTAFAAALKINKSKLTLKAGKSYTLKINGAAKAVKWKSSNKEIAVVSSKGKVTAIAGGTATITAVTEKKKFNCTVTVNDFEVKVVFTVLLTQGTTIEQSIENMKGDFPGALAIEKYDDTHYTVTMLESNRLKMAKEISNRIDQTVKEYKKSSEYSELFSDIKYDKLLTDITIYAYKEKCAGNSFLTIISPIAYVSDYVQAVNLIDVKDRSCNIVIRDNKTDIVLYQTK